MKSFPKSLPSLTALIFSICAAQAAMAQTAPAATSSAAALSALDADRLKMIAQANIAEVAAGKIALEKSTHPELRQFAQSMIDDHSKGLEETAKVAAAKNLTLPSEPDAAHKKMAADLKKLSGANFDKTYVSKAGVADHAKVLTALKDDIANAKDAEVKALATKLEPIVAHHLEMAQKLNATIK